MIAPTKADAPQAVYGCAFRGCAEQVSYPPDMLIWHGGEDNSGFYCEYCWDIWPLVDHEQGVSLAEFLGAE